jgi:predicted nucleic acid-binding protein
LKKVVFLDTSVLGVVVHTRGSDEVKDCTKWLRGLLAAGVRVCIAEICDYELRRKLLHLEFEKSIRKLDELKALVQYVPIETPAMLEASRLWATARKGGFAPAPPEALDGDMILCAQAKLNVAEGEDLVVATSNPDDFRRFVRAEGWRAIAV